MLDYFRYHAKVLECVIIIVYSVSKWDEYLFLVSEIFKYHSFCSFSFFSVEFCEPREQLVVQIMLKCSPQFSSFTFGRVEARQSCLDLSVFEDTADSFTRAAGATFGSVLTFFFRKVAATPIVNNTPLFDIQLEVGALVVSESLVK